MNARAPYVPAPRRGPHASQRLATGAPPPPRLRSALLGAAFAVWGVLSLVVGGTLMAGHWYTLPAPAEDDPALTAALRSLAPTHDRHPWLAVHVLYSQCRCSLRVLDHVFEGGRPAELLAAALRDGAGSDLTDKMARLKLEPTARRLARVAEQAKRIARRLGKGDIEVSLDDQTLRLDADRWSDFWSAFVHVVRNAVDHGLEAPDERGRAGKTGIGTLTLSTALDADEFVIRISDNGKGIDWARVRDRATELGLATETQHDLERALFAQGLSTATEVTDVSGRGVGMAAIHQACQSRGGTVGVRSEPGAGTVFEFRFPAREMSPSPTEMLNAAR